MRYFKRLVMLCFFSLIGVNISYATPLSYSISPQKSVNLVFNLAQPDGRRVKLHFLNSVLPAKFSCFFAPGNRSQYRGLTANFSSIVGDIHFLPGMNEQLIGGVDNNTVVFNATSASNKIRMGEITVTLEGDNSNLRQMVMIICTMRK